MDIKRTTKPTHKRRGRFQPKKKSQSLTGSVRPVQNKNSGNSVSAALTRNRHSNNDRPAKNNFSNLERKYVQLMDQYLFAREKYFTVFYSEDKLKRNKAETNYLAAGNNLRAFEDGLDEAGKEALKDYFFEGEECTTIMDRQREKGLYPPLREPDLSTPEEFHVLASMKGLDYSHDTEETVATEEDFKTYMKKKEQ